MKLSSHCAPSFRILLRWYTASAHLLCFLYNLEHSLQHNELTTPTHIPVLMVLQLLVVKFNRWLEDVISNQCNSNPPSECPAEFPLKEIYYSAFHTVT